MQVARPGGEILSRNATDPWSGKGWRGCWERISPET